MPEIPPHAALLREYPRGTMEAVGMLIGGTVETQILQYHWNSCCVRVSRALNYAGDPIPPGGAGAPNPYMADKKVHTYEGGDKKRYIFNTYDLRAYLTARYGQPLVFPGSATAADLGKIKCIILFNYMHSDLFNGEDGTCAHYAPGYWGYPEVTKGNLFVWKTR